MAATVGSALADAEKRLSAAGVASPGFDAAVLLGRLLGVDRGGLAVRRRDPLDPGVAARLFDAIGRRAAREPLQHITGEQEFHGRPFKVDRGVLIPRPETEGIVEAVARLDPVDGAIVADLGTGSGCIAVTLAIEHPGLQVVALDSSAEALELARDNARCHGVAGRIDFRLSDFADPPAEWCSRMSLVVSNPPYVSEAEWARLEPEVRDHEPRRALVGGVSGYEAYEALGPQALRLLQPGGHLILELGMGQERQVAELMNRAGFVDVRVDPDLRGIPRVLVARKPDRVEDDKAKETR